MDETGWTQLKATEQYEMYVKCIGKILGQNQTLDLFATRLKSLEDKLSQHTRPTESCPHTNI